MKYLVTGGAGFIGSNIVHQLVKNGQDVRVLDDFSTGRQENLAEIANAIELIKGDIRVFSVVEKSVKDCDYVLHLAALASVPRSIGDPVLSNEINIKGTLNVLEAARHAKVRKVVSSSSSAVYGDTDTLPIVESLQAAPLSPYAITKLTAEYYCRVFCELYKLPTVSLRYFNIFGPRQDPESEYAAVIPKFIKAIYNGDSPVVFGDGKQSRDFTYIDDAVNANILAATNEQVVGTELNVASGSQFTLNQLLESLKEIMDSQVEAKYIDSRPGDIMHSYADITKFKKYGYEPAVELSVGLKKTVEFFKNIFSTTDVTARANR